MPDFGQMLNLDFGEILEVVQNPTSNLTAAVLIGAAFIVVLLILVVVAWMFLLTTDDRDSRPTAAAATTRRASKGRRVPRPLPKWILPGTVMLTTIALLVFGQSINRDTHCLGCHEGAARPDAIIEVHARCADCHERPSPLFLLSNSAARLRMEATRLGGDDASLGKYEAIVENSSCLRCHSVKTLDAESRASAEASGSVGVVMSHREPVDAGMRCVECHGSVGAHVHVGADGGHPTMRLCIDCHDGEHASTDCEVCHIADPVQAVRTDPTPVAKTRLEKPAECTGCHSVASCDACHGIRLPHSETFVKGGHGYDAAFGKREEACAWCHVGTWCLEECHQGGNWEDPNATWGHPRDWATRHAEFETQDCTNCHSKQFTCESCHPE